MLDYDAMDELIELDGLARKLRRKAASLFLMPQPKDIAVLPFMHGMLQIFLPRLGVKRLDMTTEEYWRPREWHWMSGRAYTPGTIAEGVLKSRPNAVLVSTVSVRGHVIPVGEIFSAIRSQMGDKCPILIADHHHAGAIGFPGVESTNADIVCMDPCKWVHDDPGLCHLSFLWLRTQQLKEAAKRFFWPWPSVIELPVKQELGMELLLSASTVHDWLDYSTDHEITRGSLLAQHQDNMALAAEVEKRFGVQPLGGAIVFLKEPRHGDAMYERLSNLGLIWEGNGMNGARIMCRADYFEQGQVQRIY